MNQWEVLDTSAGLFQDKFDGGKHCFPLLQSRGWEVVEISQELPPADQCSFGRGSNSVPRPPGDIHCSLLPLQGEGSQTELALMGS